MRSPPQPLLGGSVQREAAAQHDRAGSRGCVETSRVSSIVWNLPALLGSSAPPCRLPLEPTSGLRAERLVAASASCTATRRRRSPCPWTAAGVRLRGRRRTACLRRAPRRRRRPCWRGRRAERDPLFFFGLRALRAVEPAAVEELSSGRFPLRRPPRACASRRRRWPSARPRRPPLRRSPPAAPRRRRASSAARAERASRRRRGRSRAPARRVRWARRRLGRRRRPRGGGRAPRRGSPAARRRPAAPARRPARAPMRAPARSPRGSVRVARRSATPSLLTEHVVADLRRGARRQLARQARREHGERRVRAVVHGALVDVEQRRHLRVALAAAQQQRQRGALVGGARPVGSCVADPLRRRPRAPRRAIRRLSWRRDGRAEYRAAERGDARLRPALRPGAARLCRRRGDRAGRRCATRSSSRPACSTAACTRRSPSR